MAWKISNFAKSTLRQAALAADLTLYVDADEVDLLPSLGVGDKAKLVLQGVSGGVIVREIVNITAWNTNGTLTVERAQEGTVARDWAAGTTVIHTNTAEVLQVILSTQAAVVYAGTATNVLNAYTVDVGSGNPVPALAEGETVRFKIPADNTGAVTLVVTNGVSSTASKSVKWQDNRALLSGDFQADWLAEVTFNAANDVWYLTSDASFQEYAEKINSGPVPAINRHPNGRVDFWNNGSSFSTPASATETADGWYPIYDGSIGTFSVSRQAFTLGQTDVPGNPKYFLRWDQSSAGSGSTLRRLRVKLPGVQWRAGEQVTRSVYLKADASRTVTGKILQNFGTGGSPSAEVEASTQAWSVTTSWQKFEVTVTLPSVSGKTLGSGADDGIYLTLDLPLNVSMTIDVAVDDIRQGGLSGLADFTFPLPLWLGGTGGSFESLTDFIGTSFPDLSAIEALAGTSGLLAKTAANSWALRDLAVGTGLSVVNAAGILGNPTISLGTPLANYHADPLSVAELASITGTFGTAAFVADSGLVHVTGTESIGGVKTFTGTMRLENTGPILVLKDTDASADEKVWYYRASGITLLGQVANDVEGSTTNWLVVTRSTTTILSVNFPNGTLQYGGVEVVSLSASQVLSNKTLTSPTINGGTSSARAQASSETSGTLTSASANKSIQMTGDVTIDNNVFAAGDMIFLYAGASARNITAGTIGTMRLDATSSTGTRSLAARGVAMIFFVSATECVVCGKGVA